MNPSDEITILENSGGGNKQYNYNLASPQYLFMTEQSLYNFDYFLHDQNKYIVFLTKFFKIIKIFISN
jgi:hypothetical protein